MDLFELFIVTLTAFITFLFFFWNIAQLKFSWSHAIPGPKLPRVTKWWYLWHLHLQDFHLVNQTLHEKYGKIVEVMPGYFSIDDADMHKTIYSHRSPWRKAEAYDAWKVGPALTNLFSERDPALHAAMRRKVASTYSMTSVISYEPYVDRCIALFQEHLDSMAVTGVQIDLAYWLRCYAFDVVSMITFGERLGFLDKGEDISGLIKNLESIRSLHTFLGVYPWLMAPVHFIRGVLTGSKRTYQQNFADKRIAMKRKEAESTTENGPVCMVMKWIIAQKSEEGESAITDRDIQINASANIGAGSETTAISLSCILFFIYQHPRVLKKLRHEIDTAMLSMNPTFYSAQQLPYLQAVIHESLRVYPASGLPMWRQVPPGGATLCGQYFPGGCNVGVNGWTANFNKEVYGSDAAEFRPERWLNLEDAPTNKLTNINYLTFGLGSRTCIGRNISFLEINKLIPIMVRDFDIEFFNPDGSRNRDRVLVGRNTFFVKPHYLHAKVSRKNTNSSPRALET